MFSLFKLLRGRVQPPWRLSFSLFRYNDLATDMNLCVNPFPSPAPFSGPANAVIVTPPLKTDAAPNTGLVIAPRLGGVRLHNPFEQTALVLAFIK